MKLATVRHQNKAILVAAIGDDRLLPLTDTGIDLRGTTASMLDLVRGGAEAMSKVREFVDDQSGTTPALLDASKVEWLPPIPNPGKICGVAMNNSASNARKISAPGHPAFFIKPASCLVGHRQPIVIRAYYGSVHPEPELAVVIGRTMRDVAPGNALDHVFGYTIFDDVTGNGMRAQDLFRYYALYPREDSPDEVEKVEQHLSYPARYKGTDTFGSMGPWIVSRDEIPNPDNLAVGCWIGDERIADDNTCYYNYKVAEVLSFLSYFHTLSPGDVISLGTAFKPGATRRSIHHANFQVVGGPVAIEIEGLGRQENPVVLQDVELPNWRLN